MMTNQEIIAVVQAAEQGRRIYAREIGKTKWFHTADPQWDFSECEYKAESPPQELWVASNDCGHFWRTFSSREEALAWLDGDTNHHIIHFREVLPEEEPE